MKTVIASLLVIFTLSQTGFSQNFVFRVMANNGSNEFKPVAASEWTPVKRGVAFKSGDMVRIANSAYLGLIHNSGKTVELVEPGTFKIDDIEVNFDIRKKGIGSKYMEFVMNTLDADSEYDDPMDVVTRGGESPVQVFVPNASEVYGSKQVISWEHGDENDSYIIRIKGIFDDILLEEETKSDNYTLDLNNPILVEEDMFIMTISRGGQEESTREYALDRLSADETTAYDRDIEEIKENVSNKLLQHLVLASYFEEKGLLMDAITNYQLAIRLAPDIGDVNELYQSFKDRHKIN